MAKIEQYDRVVAVSNGWNADLVVGKDKNLYLIQTGYQGNQLHLGPATKARIEQIIFNLNQIKSVLP